ncbi:hypothetical protein ACIBI3_44360 [Actinomadura luteofluorescens]|uniref:hypothetical protein n=1 Tax=Actinomadura luteofluorescens TaxID=46163 RepID=UPI003497B126
MRAAVWHGARDVRVQDVPDGAPGRGEVAVAVDGVSLKQAAVFEPAAVALHAVRRSGLRGRLAV